MKKLNNTSFNKACFCNLFYEVGKKLVGRSKYKRTNYYGKQILDKQNGNRYILECLENSNHFYFARLGDAELRLLFFEEARRRHLIKKVPKKIRKIVYSNAGMFSNDDCGISIFYDSFIESLPNLTGICVWYNFMEDYFCKKYAPQAELLELDSLESYLYDNPWTYGLRGKKVLIVSPFAETIKNQYLKNKDKLFENGMVLPDFDLITFKAENTIEGEQLKFSSWIETLNYMFEECMKIDFDVAILGCGAYGLPLANKLYEAGKSAIHAGGVTQVFFGVRGKRWDNRQYMKKYINDYWVRPSDSERPNNSDKVENGCYW